MPQERELADTAAELAGWFDDQEIGPAEALAVCGLFCSTMLNDVPDHVFDGFIEALRKTRESTHA